MNREQVNLQWKAEKKKLQKSQMAIDLNYAVKRGVDYLLRKKLEPSKINR